MEEDVHMGRMWVIATGVAQSLSTYGYQELGRDTCLCALQNGKLSYMRCATCGATMCKP